MKRFQFTLRDLFQATTLIAVGVGGSTWTATHREFLDSAPLLAFVIFSGSIILIGVGAGTPFHAKVIGAFIAIILAFILIAMIFGPAGA